MHRNCLLEKDLCARLCNHCSHYYCTLEVKDEVKLYADNVQNKINSVAKMVSTLRAPHNPKPDEASNKCLAVLLENIACFAWDVVCKAPMFCLPRLADELQAIMESLNASYGKLAVLLASLEMDQMDAGGVARRSC